MKQLNSNTVNRRLVILLVLVLALGLGGFLAWKTISGNVERGEQDDDYISRINQMQVISPQLALLAQAATEYDAEAYDQLLVRANDFTRILDGLVEGSGGQSLPVKIERLKEVINRLRLTWGGMELDVRVIAASKPFVFKLYSRAKSLAEAFDVLEVKYDKAVNELVRNGASARSVALVQKQLLLIERARKHLKGILAGKDDLATAKKFKADVNELVDVHERIVDKGAAGSRVAEIVREASAQFKGMRADSVGVFDGAPAIYRIGRFSDSISELSTQLLSDSAELSKGIGELFTERLYIRAVIVFIILMVLAFFVYRRAGKKLQQEHSANEENQEAILQLLDELADLADGDLTVSATVTENFTGAIADSINYAIEQMRSLVLSINKTSVQVSQEANETRSTATYLSESSAKQAKAITEATSSINTIVNSMDEVAGNADQSSKVASNSVDIANKGAGAVQNTINGMDKIREQIQKTSKQIKRLGESSQEIGDIISLINDIADQTNILSLNAAIQASMAGDAGRGFAVVADEVQRLAERSGAATKQIEVLVKAIQADTNEAVISMEQTTAEVVQGARLAQDAGVALEEIEDVSNNLAQLIQGISEAAGKQSLAAVDVASIMGVIQEITTQTSSGTEETARSIGSLAELAKDMRSSVSGFTLPADETVSVSLPDGSGADDEQATPSVDPQKNETDVNSAASAG